MSHEPAAPATGGVGAAARAPGRRRRELLARHGRWYLAGRDPRWLRRNALVALGNTARPDDERVVAVLRAHLRHADPMLRAHAAWALRRLGRPELLADLAGDTRPRCATSWRRRHPPVSSGWGSVKHLLVTNDFPPKIGGIQSYLWELWRRLPPERFAVLTSPYAGAEEWDREQPFLVRRVREPVLLPHPLMVGASRTWPRSSAPSSSCSTPPSRWG